MGRDTQLTIHCHKVRTVICLTVRTLTQEIFEMLLSARQFYPVGILILLFAGAGCSKTSSTASTITPQSFAGDTSKMPADVKAKIAAAQGSAAKAASGAPKTNTTK